MGRVPRILVVDDNGEEQPLLQEAFTTAGWVVELEWACRVDEALGRLRGPGGDGRRPDLLILDIMMSGQPSLPLLVEIRSQERLRDLPCMVVSSIAPPYLLTQQYLHQGVLRVLQKSPDFPGLVRFVESLRRFMVGHGGITQGGSTAAAEGGD